MAVKCTSTRFGSFEIPDSSIVRFPSGLLGFPDQQQYVILDHDTEAPFKWLQSVDEPDLAFVLMDPATFHSDYHVEVSADALAEIKGEQGDDLTLVVILTIPSDDPGRITANLRGPLLISHKTKLGKQLVLPEEFPTRHPLFPAETHSVGMPTNVHPECPA
ncbi:MAG: flagellar assembly protein FliW [Nitrospira sp. WS238]|nr:flagellar assembly protein FliW [Nitrospira sp. WS238]